VLHWDGTHWSAANLPSPAGATVAAFSGVSCTSAVDCFAVGASSDDTSITAQFTGAPFVEHWDGTSWSMVTAPSPSGAIEAELLGVSCPSAGDCFAVGDFETPAIGGALIEHWNGSQWSIVPNASASAALSAGRRRTVSGFRHATSRAKARQTGGFLSTPGLESVSCAGDVSCIAVGFSFSGALAEQWDGTRWSVVATPSPPGTEGSELTSVSCASPTDCSAVGDAGAVSGSGPIIDVQSVPLAEHWNGSSWSIEAEPKGATFNGLGGVSCPATTSCFAIGDSAFVQQWNGSVWSISPFSSETSQSQLNQLSCSSVDDCSAVGTFRTGLRPSTLIEHWNGSEWSVVPSPTPAGSFLVRLLGISCPTSTSCTAVGLNESFTAATPFIERWNGKKWSIVNGPTPKGAELAELSAVSCPSPTSCTAVGVQFGRTSAKVLIEQWNGKVWSIVAAPSTSSGEDAQLVGVSCPSPTSCTGVGITESFQGTRTPGAKTLIEHWDGTTWTVSPSSNPSGAPFAALNSVSCAGATSCDAVGIDAKTILSPNKPLAEHWDGTTWTIAAVPTPKGSKGGQLNSVSCRSAISCDAVGSSSTPASQILVEHWNGARWSIVGSTEPGDATSASLGGVSCPSASSCLAVGTYDARDSFFTLAERGA
jgi:hypothetical protein